MRKSELPISNPCDEDWGGMRRDPGARRFCDQCSKHVHDLTSLTEDEAREVLAQAGGERICVRYRVDGSGTLEFRQPAHKTQSPLVPVTALRRRAPASVSPRVAPIAAAPAAVLAVALAACTPHGEAEEPEAIEVIETIETIETIEIMETNQEEHVLMGDVMPVEMGDESGGEEQPCDPEATDPVEVELMGDVAWEPEPEPEAKPEPKPELKPEPEVIMGRIPAKR